MMRRAATCQYGSTNPPLTGYVLFYGPVLQSGGLQSDGITELLQFTFEATAAQTLPAVGTGQVVTLPIGTPITFTDGNPMNAQIEDIG